MLDGLQLRSSVFSRMELGAGWGFAKDCLGGAPFHIVIEGEAWVGHTPDDLVMLSAGEMAVLPGGDAHLLLSAPDAEGVPFKQVASVLGVPDWEPGLRMKPMVLRFGPPGPAVTRLVSGIFEFSDRRRNPLLTSLPDLLLLRGIGRAEARASFVEVSRLIDREIEEGLPGARLVAGRLADYLFVEAVREHLVAGDGDADGWLSGMRDPLIGRALSLIHARPEAEWSVEDLAREVNLSRSQFAERFKKRVGRGPVEYLRNWRMFTAARQLERGRMPLKEIAALAGYRSLAAFGRAFKQWSGEPPAQVRRASHAARESDAAA